jgi:prepilin signal peptidase PulO-like enzyme (type II secretory pathway)
MPDLPYMLFVFAVGSCIGSFLNVVVWRLPQVQGVAGQGILAILRTFYRSMQALSNPPSHCPKCSNRLRWYDNIPVLGWIKLGGRCRFCKAPISVQYPIVEAVTGLLFVGYYWAFFLAQAGPCHDADRPLLVADYGWLYGLDMILISGLLAASLIDAKEFIIPLEIPWTIIPIALVVHAKFDRPGGAGSLCVTPLWAALAAGAALGAILSFMLLTLGWLPASFEDGGPMTEAEREEYEKELKKQQKAARSKGGRSKGPITPPADPPRDYTPGAIRLEICKEMLFLLLPLAIGIAFVLLVWKVEPVARWWAWVAGHRWVLSSG